MKLWDHRFYTYFRQNDNYPRDSIEYNYVLNDSHQLVLQYDNGQRRYFGLFESYLSCFKWLRNIPNERQHFFETAREGARKMYYDIDINKDVCPPELFNLEYAEALKDKVIMLTLKILKCKPYDVMVFTSHGEHKYSYHLVFNSIYLPGHEHCKEIYRIVSNDLNEQEQIFVDKSVYKSLQQLRLLGSQKPNSNRPKIFHKEWCYQGQLITYKYSEEPDSPEMELLQQFNDSLISIIDSSVSTMIEIKVMIRNTSEIQTNIHNFTTETMNNILKLVPNSEAFSIRREYNNMIILTRHSPTYCEVCQRTHENENPFLYIRGINRLVYMDCRRSDDQLLLGKISDVEDIEGDIESIISQTQLNESQPNISQPNISQPNISQPNISQPNISQPNISQPSSSGTPNVPRCIINIIDPNNHYAFKTPRFGYSPIKADIEYTEQYMKPIKVQPNQILLRQGYLGKGKTRSIIEWIKEHNPKRVLYLSSRQMFARSITAELNRHLPTNVFTCYLNVTLKSDLIHYDRLVLQMESLIHLNWVGREDEIFINPTDRLYDVLVLDEVESLLKQFSSDKTMGKKRHQCAMVFERLVANTPYVIGADAFLTSRSKRVLRQINPRIIIERNLHPPVKRRCLQYDNKSDFIHEARNAVYAGKNIVMVWGSKDAMLKFEHAYLKNNGISYKIYHGGTDDNTRNDLSIVNKTWSEVQVVMYTASITVGVSFDQLYFDELFVYGSCMSMSVRDLFQAMMRVRHLRNNIMHCYLQTTYCRYDASMLTIGEKYIVENLRKKISDMDQFMREYSLSDLWKVLPPWLSVVCVLNMKEDAYTALHFQRTFNTYLILCNYTKTTIQSSRLKLDDIKLPTIDYDQIREISGRNKQQIERKIRNGIANEIERLELDKYIFEHLLIAELPKEVRQVLYTDSWTKGLKHKYIGCYHMKNKTIEDAFNKDLNNHYKINASMREVQLAEINKLNNIMGLSDSGQSKTWNHNEFMNLSNQIIQDFDKNSRLFHVRTKTRRTNIKGLTKVLLRKVYGTFNTSKIIDVRYRPKINGKQVDQSRLVKTPCYIMHCIKGSSIEHAPKTSEEMKQLMELSNGTHLKKNKVPPDRARLIINTPRARIIITK